MKITIDHHLKINAGLFELIPAENLIFSYKNEQIITFLGFIKSLSENENLFSQLPVLLKYKTQPTDTILSEIVMGNVLTGYFACFGATVISPNLTNGNHVCYSEWFYIPLNESNKIEKNLQTWIEKKREDFRDNHIFYGMFSIIHAPSLLSTPECLSGKTKFYEALKKLPANATIFKQIPTLKEINKISLKESLNITKDDAKLEFLQNLITTSSLTGYFVELGMQVTNSSNNNIIHLTEWIYVSTLNEAEDLLNTWLNERDKELDEKSVGEDK